MAVRTPAASDPEHGDGTPPGTEVLLLAQHPIRELPLATRERTNCNSPAESYSQQIPPRLPYDKSVGLPVLPTCLEVILNKDVASNNEPILLPEPNHVMFNHLYALSIKDGVMLLSAILRYKKKYVTTLLYKPI
ncbi:5'-AMP-activated protein kinase subunit beta-1 [Trichonephila clavipes]|uniref:5'-AMP-activated protein kinase subunit beta-1 n=1 Tax=Trichonephila clavipes TaxID=2585209 RepID=A0A8X6R6P9_TRICX|nr:5'-AMP-activated protein kinase subunit beta-1 [Trichonephila clavipes]